MFREMLLAIEKKIKEMNLDNKNIIVWGMGYVAMLYENAFKNEGINIFAYTGKDASKFVGGGYNGYPVIEPDEILTVDNPLILITVKNPIYLQQIENKIKKISVDIDYFLIDEFFFGKNAEVILNNIQVLEDDKSKEIYKQIIDRRIRNEMKMYDLFEENQYWALPLFRVDDIDEVCVDMGGFVGDTLERYLFAKLGTFKRYYIFEPDERNYNALLKRIARLNEEWRLESDQIVPIFAGVGREDSTYYFEELNSESCGSGSCGSHYTMKDTGIERKIVQLDSYFENTKVNFLKADIESYEFDMLLGAIKILKRDRPKLAISIYHNAVDMYHILAWLENLKLGYKFYIRHHSVRDTETVLYAVCD